MAKKRQEQKGYEGYAIFDPDDKIYFFTIKEHKEDSIEAYDLLKDTWSWETSKREGWTCRKVVIREI